MHKVITSAAVALAAMLAWAPAPGLAQAAQPRLAPATTTAAAAAAAPPAAASTGRAASAPVAARRLPVLYLRAPLAASASRRDFILEGYPEPIARSRSNFDADLKAAATGAARFSDVPQYVIVEASRRWSTERVISVAFNGGSDAVLAQIADVAQDWVRLSGAGLRFQFKDRQGRFLRWAATDVLHAADIRIAFKTGRDDGGYWSLVGRESINATLVGGGPGQASMNLAGMDARLPTDWQTVVRHEFGHALGFQHEHQSPAGGCDFRFDDDPGYVPELINGRYQPNLNGKRPGLYTALSGLPNAWKVPEVDHNLRRLQNSRAYSIGPFDKQSIMKYRFEAAMFLSGHNSPCFTDEGDNNSLSSQDIVGVRSAYPTDDGALAALSRQGAAAALALSSLPNAPESVRNATQIQRRALGMPSTR